MVRLSTVLILVVLFSSCKSTYVANSRNVSLFREAKESMVTVALSSGLDVQTAYAVTDHIGVMGNANALKKKFSTNDGASTYNRDYLFGELGLGLYGKSRGARYEVYGGYGLGKGTSYEGLYLFAGNTGNVAAVVATGKFNRIFIQPSIATNKKNFNLALTMRGSLVDFTEFESGGVVKKPIEGFKFFLEPSLTTTFKLAGTLRGFFQINITNPIPSESYFEFERFQTAIGIQLHTGSLRTRVY